MYIPIVLEGASRDWIISMALVGLGQQAVFQAVLDLTVLILILQLIGSAVSTQLCRLTLLAVLWS